MLHCGTPRHAAHLYDTGVSIMKKTRTIGFGILGALACTLALAGGCATDEATTCKEGSCGDSSAACCSGKDKSDGCCKDKAAGATTTTPSKDAAKN